MLAHTPNEITFLARSAIDSTDSIHKMRRSQENVWFFLRLYFAPALGQIETSARTWIVDSMVYAVPPDTPCPDTVGWHHEASHLALLHKSFWQYFSHHIHNYVYICARRARAQPKKTEIIFGVCHKKIFRS